MVGPGGTPTALGGIASAVLPAIYKGEKGKLIDSYEQFGRCLGKGFQIHDDILELTADSQTMGKSLGSDITEGKQTLMVIKARNEYPDKWNDKISSSGNQEQFNNICKFFKNPNHKALIISFS